MPRIIRFNPYAEEFQNSKRETKLSNDKCKWKITSIIHFRLIVFKTELFKKVNRALKLL